MTITATNTASVTETLFKKLDTKQNGYIDAADLKAAVGADSAVARKSAEVFKQFDSDSDGKVAKSELSAAVEKVRTQLDAQMDPVASEECVWRCKGRRRRGRIWKQKRHASGSERQAASGRLLRNM